MMSTTIKTGNIITKLHHSGAQFFNYNFHATFS